MHVTTHNIGGVNLISHLFTDFVDPQTTADGVVYQYSASRSDTNGGPDGMSVLGLEDHVYQIFYDTNCCFAAYNELPNHRLYVTGIEAVTPDDSSNTVGTCPNAEVDTKDADCYAIAIERGVYGSADISYH